MVVKFQNFEYSYLRNDKPVYCPSSLGRKIGKDIKTRVSSAYKFQPYYMHLCPGGHVAALHRHRQNNFYFRLDLRNFFYSVGRNRIVQNLVDIKVADAGKYARWSCVKNPLEGGPSYALPYGFIQSPILATLALSQSGLGHFLTEVGQLITLTVYVDDITGSASDINVLESAFAGIRAAIVDSPFSENVQKTIPPRESLNVFNCDLRLGSSSVSEVRRARFYSEEHNPASIEGFERYTASVEIGNQV